ncbi:ran GTPase-activating protein 1-like isoform X2 [Mizuhopecten yessoensis]|uniref:Ran GTPase-activating protein 1 n=1 Tax=Mizuhopecten yessoensis TaxID=6573 RepID=A0A210PLC4_MIZYE|nr:ran GTPase-activating protein 1-like isoform X2 [Mizuhopecten yessoensis]OWF37292.1 Ran GTPase-activating protein 1 [Mizuhopecten yessoensis]
MASSDISQVTDQLAKTKVDETYELSFKGRGLKLNTAKDAEVIANEIEECKTMTALRMEGNTLGADAAEVIAEALQKHPEFQRAHWSDMFTGRLKTEIPPALKHLGKAIIAAGAGLVELDLSDNAFGPTGVDGLIELLKSPSCYTLKELKLNNNGLGIGGGKILSQCLLDCHKSSCAAGKPLALRVFISGRNRLENDGATALAAAFKAIGTLEEITMPQNGINPPGISALADAIAHNKGLKRLNLNDNTFTVAGAKSIAKVLPHVQKLEVLNFGDCLVRTDGAKVLASAIADSHTSLREVNFSGNEISKPGATAIADAMENKVNLELLDLDSNQLGEDGVEEVKGTMEAINKSDKLGSLSGDEGTDDEDEEEGDVHGEEVEAKEDEDGDAVDDPELQVKGKAISPEKQSVSAKDFLAFPSPTKLIQLGTGRAAALKQELGSDCSDVDKAVQTFIKVSSVVTPVDTKTKEAACDCTDKLFEDLLLDSTEGGASLFANSLLVNMGVLKGEDKKFRPPSSIVGPLTVLEYAVKQPYFPKQSREILSAFITKPHPLLDKSGPARHNLLQTLFKF